MGTIGSVVADLSMETTKWSQGSTRAVKDVEKIDKSYHSFLEKTKSGLGRRSNLGETFELLKGAGAVAGLSVLGEELSGWSAKIIEIRNAMNDGTKSTGDMVDAIAGGVPVFGKFWEAGRNIREIFTGEKAAIEEANKEAERQKTIMDSSVNSARAYKKALEEIAAEGRKTERDTKKVGADQFTQQRIDLDQQKEDAEKARKDRQAAADKDLEDKANPGLKAARDKRDRLQAKADDAGFREDDAYNHFDGNSRMLAAVEDLNAVTPALKAAKAEVLRLEQDFHAKKAAIDTAGAGQAKKDAAKFAATDADIAKRQGDEQQKITTDIDKKTTDAVNRARIENLKAGGYAERAQVREIQDGLNAQKTQNIKDAKDRLKTAGAKEGDAFYKKTMDAVADENAALTSEANGKIKQITDAAAKSERDMAATPAEAFKNKIADYQKQLDAGAIKPETFNRLKDAATKEFKDSLLPKDEETPFAKYKEEVQKYADALDKGIITQQEFKKAVADSQDELKQAATPKFQSNQSQVRRFSFGELSAPKMATPFQDMLKVSQDQAQTQKDIHDAIIDTNKILKDKLPDATAVISGAGW